jgi:hypothetical protein
LIKMHLVQVISLLSVYFYACNGEGKLVAVHAK